MWFYSVYCYGLYFFLFKQKTAYERRISDWSSDVCSSDLINSELVSNEALLNDVTKMQKDKVAIQNRLNKINSELANNIALSNEKARLQTEKEIGRASCRERVCQYV